MKRAILNNRSLAVLLAAFAASATLAKDGQIRLIPSGSNTLLQIVGDKDDDWRIQVSTNLTIWNSLTSLGTLLSGGTNPPARSIGNQTQAQLFFCGLQTAGLFDPTLLRTLSLTFTQNNWVAALTSARTYNSNVYSSPLTLDNCATNVSVGARFKGNTSFTMSGVTRSINLRLFQNSVLLRIFCVVFEWVAGCSV